MLVRRGSVYHLRIMHQGRLYQKSLHTQQKAEAVKLEAAFRTSLIRGEFGIIDGGQAPTLAEFESRLFLHLKSRVTTRTLGFYKENYATLLRFEPMATTKLHQISPSLIEQFIQWRLKQGVVTVTVNHSLRVLRRALILARDWSMIRDVPRIKLLPGEHEREYVLSEQELRAMVDCLRKTYPRSLMSEMLPFLVDTGLRISEACGLLREHVSLDSRPYLRVVKGKSKYARREVPLTERAANAIRAALKESSCEYVWSNGNKPMTRHYPSEQFRTVRDALKISRDCVLHSTRHTFCTRLGKAGADAFVIQRLAGHSSITISQRYVHSDRELKEGAIRRLEGLEKPMLLKILEELNNPTGA